MVRFPIASALVSLLGLAVLVTTSRPDPEAATRHVHPEPLGHPAAPLLAGPGGQSDTCAARATAPTEDRDDGTPEPALTVRVVRTDDLSPFAGEVVRVRRVGSAGVESSTGLDRTTDAAGVARFDGLAPGSYLVLSLRTTGRAVALAPEAHTEVTLTVARGLELAGRVVDSAGRGVAGAELLLSERWNPARVAPVALTDATGAFALVDVLPESCLSARAAGLAATHQLVPRGAPGERLVFELVLDRLAVPVSGLVLDPAGSPLAGALVVFGDEPTTFERRGAFDALPPAPLRLVTDGAGRFATDAAPAGPITVHVRANGALQLDLTLDLPEAGLHGLVLEPVPAARMVRLPSLDELEPETDDSPREVEAGGDAAGEDEDDGTLDCNSFEA